MGKRHPLFLFLISIDSLPGALSFLHLLPVLLSEGPDASLVLLLQQFIVVCWTRSLLCLVSCGLLVSKFGRNLLQNFNFIAIFRYFFSLLPLVQLLL